MQLFIKHYKRETAYQTSLKAAGFVIVVVFVIVVIYDYCLMVLTHKCNPVIHISLKKE